MVKLIVIESDLGRGIKLPGGKTINMGKPVLLSGREIFRLFTKKVKVFEMVNGNKIRLTPDNYLDNNNATEAVEVVVEEDELLDDTDTETDGDKLPEEDTGETDNKTGEDAPDETAAPETSETGEIKEDLVEEDEEKVAEDVAEETKAVASEDEEKAAEEKEATEDEEKVAEEEAEKIAEDTADEVVEETAKAETPKQQYKKRR